MTDWGDAVLNEKARPRTWVAAPPEPEPPPGDTATAQAELPLVPRPQPADPPLTQHDKGARILPEGGK